MNIYTTTATPKDKKGREYGDAFLVFRTASKVNHLTESFWAQARNKHDYNFVEEIEDLEDCPVCDLPLSEHGTTTEIDTIESCIEIDRIGDL